MYQLPNRLAGHIQYTPSTQAKACKLRILNQKCSHINTLHNKQFLIKDIHSRGNFGNSISVPCLSVLVLAQGCCCVQRQQHLYTRLTLHASLVNSMGTIYFKVRWHITTTYAVYFWPETCPVWMQQGVIKSEQVTRATVHWKLCVHVQPWSKYCKTFSV